MKVAILIKTFRREACLFNTLDSIAAFCDVPYRLYIGDDGPVSPEKRSRYDRLASHGHIIKTFDEPTPVTTARNALIRLLDEEDVVLRIDDDFEFFEKTNLRALKAILDADDEIGAVADIEIQCGDGKGVKDGEYSQYQGFFEIRDGTLFKSVIPVPAWSWKIADGYRYAYADHTRNFLMIRRGCLDECPWDERIFVEREHADFLMTIKAAGWKLAFTPDCVHRHRDDLALKSQSAGYLVQRRIDSKAHSGTDVMLEKWGVKKFRTVRDDFRTTPSREQRMTATRDGLEPAEGATPSMMAELRNYVEAWRPKRS